MIANEGCFSWINWHDRLYNGPHLKQVWPLWQRRTANVAPSGYRSCAPKNVVCLALAGLCSDYTNEAKLARIRVYALLTTQIVIKKRAVCLQINFLFNYVRKSGENWKLKMKWNIDCREMRQIDEYSVTRDIAFLSIIIITNFSALRGEFPRIPHAVISPIINIRGIFFFYTALYDIY